MVDAMNAAGMDFAIFGNHEFDIKESELQERVNESNFQWVSTNTFHKENNSIVPFQKTKNGITTNFPMTFIQSIKDGDGATAKIGFIALTLPFNKASYVSYTVVFSSAKQAFNQQKILLMLSLRLRTTQSKCSESFIKKQGVKSSLFVCLL